MSDILKECQKWLEVNVADGRSWKKKQRTAQFPILEDHLVEWVDRANQQHIAINDFVLRAAAQELIAELSKMPSHINSEDYTDFILSNGWLYSFKQQNALSGKKMQGDGAAVDANLLPQMQEDLQNQLQHFQLKDIFNCDELALQ